MLKYKGKKTAYSIHKFKKIHMIFIRKALRWMLKKNKVLRVYVKICIKAERREYD